MWPYTVRKEDLRIDTYRPSGHGGQHMQKTDSAVRITHIITGISAQSQDSRFQAQNIKIAFNRLADKLVPIMKSEVLKNDFKVENHGKVIRSYREKDRIVKDERLADNFDYVDVLKGNGLGKIIDKLVVN